MEDTDAAGRRGPRRWPAAAVWGVGWALLLMLGDRLDLSSLALGLVLVSACAALWLPPWAVVLGSLLSVLCFDLAFVPPRGELRVALHQHLLLLLALLAVSTLVALLTARQHRMAAQAQQAAAWAEALRGFAERLREAADPRREAEELLGRLRPMGGGDAALLLPPADAGGDGLFVGAVNGDEAAGLRLCAGDGRAMGPGTGRHEEQPAWYLPLRGRQRCIGAALLRGPAPASATQRRQAQALCDQMGLAIERADALHQAAAAHAAAQAQTLRNTLLTAIAHDHRTPLATILGAATALHDQAERLQPVQQRRLATTIADEAGQLARLTENMLQLARLGTPGSTLQRDWESAEEIVGGVLRRIRTRHPQARVRARIDAGLPLLRADAALLLQLLDNLVDNALKHGGADPQVEILARRAGDRLLLAVRDRGPGVLPAQRPRIFDLFQRGDAATGRGSGVGLAVCQAIAQAHGAELRCRARTHGGLAFELWLPIEPPPAAPAAEPG